jgi:hypothetical protein
MHFESRRAPCVIAPSADDPLDSMYALTYAAAVTCYCLALIYPLTTQITVGQLCNTVSMQRLPSQRS